jgi:hypothetical protein
LHLENDAHNYGLCSTALDGAPIAIIGMAKSISMRIIININSSAGCDANKFLRYVEKQRFDLHMCGGLVLTATDNLLKLFIFNSCVRLAVAIRLSRAPFQLRFSVDAGQGAKLLLSLVPWTPYRLR